MNYNRGMEKSEQQVQQHYWYADASEKDPSVGVLEAMRTFRAAEIAMERRTQQSTGMNGNDLLALRYVILSQQDGRTIGPKELAAYLGISSASTTVLIDRLERAGKMRRENSPFDRRALILVPTATTDEEIHDALGEVPERLVEVANTLTADEAETVIRFLDDMRAAVDEIDAHDASTSD